MKRNDEATVADRIVFTSDASRDNLQAAFFLNSSIIRDAGFDPTKPVTLEYGQPNHNTNVNSDIILDGVEIYKREPQNNGMTKLDMSPGTQNKAASIDLHFNNNEEYAVYIKDLHSNQMVYDWLAITQDGRSVKIDETSINVEATRTHLNQKFIPGETYELATLYAKYNLARLLESGQLKASKSTDSSFGIYVEPDRADRLKVMYKAPTHIKTTQQLSLQVGWTFTGPRRSDDMHVKHNETASFTFDVTVGSDALDNQPTYPVATVKPGEASTVDPTSYAYNAEYKINDAKLKLPSGWSAPTIDAKTGAITVNAPKTAKTGDVIDIPLTVTYRDGTVDNETIRFTVNEKETFVSNIVKNEDGTYTLTLNNGDDVQGNIDPRSGSVTNVKPDGKGNLIITIDGKDNKVPLDQVKVTESNEGKPNHTITITAPDGQSVTFNAYDRHVNNVEKLENGDYKVTRNDGKSWTIVLKDLRDKIATLEDRASKLEKKDQALQDEIDDLKKKLGTAEKNIEGLKDKNKGLEDEIRKINAHLSTLHIRVDAIDAKIAELEGRVGAVEDTNKKWAKCYSGIGMAAIPLALAAPLAHLSSMDIPMLNQANTDIQKRLGVYNPELASAWGQYGGIMKVLSVVVGLMGAIGAITYAGTQCGPYNKTDDAKDTPLGQLSSKVESAEARASSK